MNLKETTILLNGFLMESAPGAVTTFNGKEYIYFGGTSYYELHRNEKVIAAAVEATKKYGICSATSRSGFGTTTLIEQLEIEAANFFQTEKAIYISSGFLTDSAAIKALNNLYGFDKIFIDEYSHNSNQFASVLTGKETIKFSHLNPNSLKEKLESHLNDGAIPLVITDGIFPVFGTIAPLKDYLEIIEKYNGLMWVDDAHGIGILGKNGRGTVEEFGINSKNVFFGGTFSKALGGFGGIIPGESELINEIKNGEVNNGTTPPPSTAVGASLAGLRIFRANLDLKNKLYENVRRMKEGLYEIGIDVLKNNVPITAWKMKNQIEMKRIQVELIKKGIMIQNINYAGAGENGVLRIVVFSSHTAEQIDYLITELKKLI